ncbi:DNA-binding response regulator [Fibrisoma montanum]|uniref:DNA-binding response regulator n=1 Tax=Fibrisoma montanum TaxID=2305895 RepID=A0A418MK68_9BACT|nr:LytTR family DNA-binding domain-containing protein [Fibrisoma montanum]RIV27776.1 DNA-binding response regulator [Fibrisoma montanum]
MKALIIEDEAIIADKLKRALEDIAPQIDVQAILPSLKAARRWFMQHAEPDLLFMDIQLSDGISFELFQYFDLQCPIIFTTAYDEYAIKAFKHNAIDYLLKPVDEEELILALNKLKKRTEKVQFSTELIQAMLQRSGESAKKAYREKLLVHQRNTLVLIDTADIALFYRNEIIFILRNDGQTYVADQASLDEVEELVDPSQFFRANRTQIINLNSIDSYRQDSTGKIHLKLKTTAASTVEISRDKAHSFRRWLNR